MRLPGAVIKNAANLPDDGVGDLLLVNLDRTKKASCINAKRGLRAEDAPGLVLTPIQLEFTLSPIEHAQAGSHANRAGLGGILDALGRAHFGTVQR